MTARTWPPALLLVAACAAILVLAYQLARGFGDAVAHALVARAADRLAVAALWAMIALWDGILAGAALLFVWAEIARSVTARWRWRP